MYVVEKKITGWIVLQYKIIITKYQNIAINKNIDDFNIIQKKKPTAK
jgi:hypothetical protein